MDTTNTNSDGPARVCKLLGFLYGGRADEALGLIEEVVERRLPELERAGRLGVSSKAGFDESDALLITYGDMIAPKAHGSPGSVNPEGTKALARLAGFIDRWLYGLFSYIHILPFFPYSSDDGFSVMDYQRVNPDLGSWADIEALGAGRSLVFDLVLNHASAQGGWFRAFRAGQSPYDRFFITRPLDYDSKMVLRPRTNPLITPVRLDDGRTVGVWTTFSADQVDLDFSEPVVLAEFVDIMLAYAAHGAGMIRLDAIAYLWKQDGTSCVHLPQTHAVVKLLRALIDYLGLDIIILTETNVPQEENLSYFGDGDEAHMVYNFSLPPLVLHAFVTGDTGPLSNWAASLRVPEGGAMLNFLASHDGVGVTEAKNLITDFERTIEAVVARGGLVSYNATPEGPVPYELNVSWADAVAAPGADNAQRAHALVASYAVACAMDGVPALYFHSMIGSRSWHEGPRNLGYNRAINRERPALDELEAALKDPSSMRRMTLTGMTSLLRERARRPAFSPSARRVAWPASGPIFVVERGEGEGAILVLVNCSPDVAETVLPEPWRREHTALDPVRGSAVDMFVGADGRVKLGGYEVIWIEQT